MFLRKSTAKKCSLVVTIICISVFVLTKLFGKSDQGQHASFVKQTRKEKLEHDFDLVIVVMSAPLKSASRNVLRETWLSTKNRLNNPRVRHFFVVGSKHASSATLKDLEEENSIYGDLIFLNIEDSYSSLTDKLLAAFQWLHSNISFHFVLKCDDDSFVRIAGLLKELKQQPQQLLYWGFFKGGSTVFMSGKWKETNWFLCDTYLPYALGGGYILSSDLVAYLSANAPLLQRYKSEDASLGLWLSPLKVNRVHDTRFDTEWKSRGCFNSYLVTHKQSADDMRAKHSHLEMTGQMCSTEFRSRSSYNYNWTVPPSLCCKNVDPHLP